MSKQVPYLLTGPEKFLQRLGNGSSNLDSHIASGKKTAAILKKKGDSISAFPPWEVWPFPSEDSSGEKEANGSPEEILTKVLFQWGKPIKQHKQYWLKTG
jgi:hypothetical protein